MLIMVSHRCTFRVSMRQQIHDVSSTSVPLRQRILGSANYKQIYDVRQKPITV